MQTYHHSRLEIGADFSVSLCVNLVTQMLFYGALATAGRSLTFAALVLGLAVPRRYAIRRLFNALVTPEHDSHAVNRGWKSVSIPYWRLSWPSCCRRLLYSAATWTTAGGLTVVLYTITMGRRYALRRVFEAWHVRQENLPLYSQASSAEL